MTCIVELICRGNIQNIDNDKFKLVSTDNLLDYEKQLINLLFKEKTIISFSQINEMFINNNKNTSSFVKEFKEIKKKILDKIFSLELYSKIGEYILKFIRTISILVYVNIFILIRNIIMIANFNFTTIIAINIITLIIIYLFKYILKNNNLLYSKTGNKLSIGWRLGVLLMLNAVILFYSFYEHYIIFTLIVVLLILNTIIIFKSKLHILTKKGKEEYAKVYGIKSYIVDFSLMDEKDIDSTIIWDEYLAYAVAFSVPNKITNKFNSALMKSNIILQHIDKFLTS